MSFVAFNCPDCNQRIEAPPETVDYEFQCPTCESTFVPSEASDLEYVSSRKPAKRTFVKSNAVIVSWVSFGFIGLAGVSVLAGLIAAIANDPHNAVICYYAAGGLLAAGFLLCLLAQLLHIRAELEEMNNE
ncbi:MAG TPA: hypothetical protein VH255_04860 [Verrucomicrobiae bacterium]|nr:hypothetical protein [Verrucomicrobiae bacterium]